MEGPFVAVEPGGDVLVEDEPHEPMPGKEQGHDERPGLAFPLRLGIVHEPRVAEVYLRLIA